MGKCPIWQNHMWCTFIFHITWRLKIDKSIFRYLITSQIKYIQYVNFNSQSNHN